MNDNSNQYTENYMIDFALARQLVYDNAILAPGELIPISEASGRILAEPVFASVSIPSFDNSAMDGYAVNADDLINANTSNPVSLKLAGLTVAGEATESPADTEHNAWKIMTGAPVPRGFDSIIPVENTKLEYDQVICFSAPVLGAHIRCSGEDFQENELVSKPGKLIDSNTIMAYSALGLKTISVQRKIDVAVFSTGRELVDDPTIPLKPGQIRNSNKAFIFDWFKTLPINIFDAGTNYDQPELFEKDLKKRLDDNVDIIISSGAVSMGDFDFIPQVIINLGGNIIFHKSKIRPGKPILFAKFPNGCLYFGLPGNPISAAIGLRFFVGAAINKLLGHQLEFPSKAITANQVTKKLGVRAILKANAKINLKAQNEVSILEGQQSFKIKPLLEANGWAVVTEEIKEVNSGDIVEFYPSSLYGS